MAKALAYMTINAARSDGEQVMYWAQKTLRDRSVYRYALYAVPQVVIRIFHNPAIKKRGRLFDIRYVQTVVSQPEYVQTGKVKTRGEYKYLE